MSWLRRAWPVIAVMLATVALGYPVALLFGLMVVSSAFVVAGFYDWAAVRIATLRLGPKALLAVFVSVSGALSAVLTNDVVAVANKYLRNHVLVTSSPEAERQP